MRRAASHSNKIVSGCADHPDCFTCEETDCTWDEAHEERRRAEMRAEEREKEKAG